MGCIFSRSLFVSFWCSFRSCIFLSKIFLVFEGLRRVERIVNAVHFLTFFIPFFLYRFRGISSDLKESLMGCTFSHSLQPFHRFYSRLVPVHPLATIPQSHSLRSFFLQFFLYLFVCIFFYKKMRVQKYKAVKYSRIVGVHPLATTPWPRFICLLFFVCFLLLVFLFLILKWY